MDEEHGKGSAPPRPTDAASGLPLRRSGGDRASDIPVFAALDLGTNNCRLLLARPVPKDGPNAFRVVDAFSRIVRLGEKGGRDGCLSPEAADRAIAALRVCANKIRRREVAGARLVATEACRRAADGPNFLKRVTDETGLELEVISAEEEATLALTGCAPLFDRQRPYALVFDIGGGSTEVSWLRLGRQGTQRLLATHSMPLGVVGLADAFGGVEVTPATYDAMVERTLAALSGFDADGEIGHELRRGRVQVLGTSGTVTTLAGIKLDLPRYDRSRVDGSFLTRKTASQVTRRLIDMSYAARASHPCIGRDRADLVLAGCAILEAILRRWPAERLRVADRGLREGIILQLIRAWRGAGHGEAVGGAERILDGRGRRKRAPSSVAPPG